MDLYELLEDVVRKFVDLKIPYLVTGSVASMAYGEPRLTNDIDIVARIRRPDVPGLLAAFPEDDFYISEEAVRDAVRSRGQFNIIHPASGLKVDVIVGKDTPFDQGRFARAQRVRPVATYEASFAAPEDVIIKKMEYYREGGSDKHLRDIASMLRISAGEIDESYISQWADELGLKIIWEAIKQRIGED